MARRVQWFVMLFSFFLLAVLTWGGWSEAQEGAGLSLAKGKPKVMILIDEKVAGIFGTTAWEQMGQMEAVLQERFLATGFVVVDPQTVRANLSRDKALRLLEGDARAAAVVGLQHGAQVVVTGKAMSKPAGGKLLGTQMQSIQATVQARVVRTDDARVLASRTASGVQAHLDEVQGGALALREAGERLADQLIDDILAQWEQEVAGAQEVRVVISGLVSIRHLEAVKGYLASGVLGVRGVYQRSYTQGVAELMVEYGGKASQLASTIAQQRFTGFRLEPTNVTPNQIDLRAVVAPGKKR